MKNTRVLMFMWSFPEGYKNLRFNLDGQYVQCSVGTEKERTSFCGCNNLHVILIAAIELLV